MIPHVGFGMTCLPHPLLQETNFFFIGIFHQHPNKEWGDKSHLFIVSGEFPFSQGFECEWFSHSVECVQKMKGKKRFWLDVVEIVLREVCEDGGRRMVEKVKCGGIAGFLNEGTPAELWFLKQSSMWWDQDLHTSHRFPPHIASLLHHLSTHFS